MIELLIVLVTVIGLGAGMVGAFPCVPGWRGLAGRLRGGRSDRGAGIILPGGSACRRDTPDKEPLRRLPARSVPDRAGGQDLRTLDDPARSPETAVHVKRASTEPGTPIHVRLGGESHRAHLLHESGNTNELAVRVTATGEIGSLLDPVMPGDEVSLELDGVALSARVAHVMPEQSLLRLQLEETPGGRDSWEIAYLTRTIRLAATPRDSAARASSGERRK